MDEGSSSVTNSDPTYKLPEPERNDTQRQHNNNKEEKQENAEEEEEKIETNGCAALESRTLPWQAHRERELELESQVRLWTKNLNANQTQNGSKTKAKWRESMPEGERWEDERIEVGGLGEKGNGSSGCDDEYEKQEDIPLSRKKSPLDFTPNINIVCPSGKLAPEQEMGWDTENQMERGPVLELQRNASSPVPYYPEWTAQKNSNTCTESLCGDKLKVSLGIAAAALLFPLLTWGGFALLPFDVPLLKSSPLRLIYTLRCSLFAAVPIILGVVVQGFARLRYRSLAPLYDGKMENREVAVHWHYISDSLSLFLLFFLQLAIMATYINQDLLKLVPMLTIVFTFGRLIYWVCVSLRSTVRSVGFGLSFLPILVMLGVNIYYVCSSLREEALFVVAPPTTPPPPRQRWWG